jgi:hypothetical protein
MKKNILLMAVAAICCTFSFSQACLPDSASAQVRQGCLPEGITFDSQEQIDNFSANYPGCNEIEGSVTIYDYNFNNITNLNGLSVLSEIGGDVSIYGTFQLTNLTGLNNLTTIGGSLGFGSMDWGNPALSSLTGLEGLTSIGGCLCIGYCPALGSIEALQGLTSVHDIQIQHVGLTNLTGLENLSSLPGSLTISATSVNNLTGLGGLTSIGGSLLISASPLTDLTGLNNVVTIGGSVFIHQTDWLTSLSGLNHLTSVGGNLSIGSPYVSNNALISLSGLEGLTSIGGNIYIQRNPVLVSLTGLENVSSINGNLLIAENDTLIDLSGLSGLNGGSIINLSILDNAFLSECAIQSICEYLASPNGTVEINGNAPGCNNAVQVQEACQAGIENNPDCQFSITPNPATTAVTIILPEVTHQITLTILNLNGQEIFHQSITEPITQLDISNLPGGIYLIKLKNDKTVETVRFIKL